MSERPPSETMKRTIRLSLILALALVSPTFAADLNVQVLRVVDGDTIRVCLLEPAPEILRVNLVRLRGCDAPELHDQRPELRDKAQSARSWIAGRVHVGDKLRLEDVKRDKYGRFLATVRVSGQDLAQGLIAAGLAKTYDGGRRSWYGAPPVAQESKDGRLDHAPCPLFQLPPRMGNKCPRQRPLRLVRGACRADSGRRNALRAVRLSPRQWCTGRHD